MPTLNLPIHLPKAPAIAAILTVAAVLATLIFATAVPGVLAQSDHPAAPTGLTASAGQDQGEIDASWDAHPDQAKDYRVTWAKTEEDFKKWNVTGYSAFPTGTSYTINGLDDATQYKVRVRARFDSGKPSDWTTPVLVTTQEASQEERTTHIETPQNFRATSTAYEQVIVEWDAPTSSDVTYTQLERTGGGLGDLNLNSSSATAYATPASSRRAPTPTSSGSARVRPTSDPPLKFP